MTNKINDVIEIICQQGCTSVESVIVTLEKGDTIDDETSLTATERVLILKELKEIMLVYKNK